MRDYRVIWEIDIHAGNPRAAAEQAAKYMQEVDLRDPDDVTVFRVIDEGQARETSIDLARPPYYNHLAVVQPALDCDGQQAEAMVRLAINANKGRLTPEEAGEGGVTIAYTDGQDVSITLVEVGHESATVGYRILRKVFPPELFTVTITGTEPVWP